MTIKPVVVVQSTQSKRGAAVDAEKKEPQHVDDSQNVVRSVASHSHRNAVIDAQPTQRRGEVFDEIARHRRSPHKSNRSKRRERNEREKHANASTGSTVSSKCSSPHMHAVGAANVVSSGGSSPASVGIGGKSPERLSAIPVVLGCQSPNSQAVVTQAAVNLLKATEEASSGYNSGDEHLQPKENSISADEWQRRDEQFAKCMSDRGYVLKPVEEDGACLFRSISLQIYGDEEMHDVIRQHTMDYIYKNREYFCHFVTEDINSYIKRKRRKDSHGNHIEIQAMSEIYNRPVELYCYKQTPINIFNSEQLNNGFAPLRLSYQRGSHYNAILDPYNATVGVGLGLAGYKPELQTKEAARLNEQLEIEQTMFEDKLKTTDWEATNEAIEEQIARESYLQWCRDNLQKSRAVTCSSTAASSSSTVTSAEAASDSEASPSKYAVQRSSTVTATSLSAATSSGSAAATCSGNLSSTSGFLSVKPISALMHNHKKDGAGATDVECYNSDDTDRSSTCSSGNVSPSAVGNRAKKIKTAGGGIRSTKKRRNNSDATKNCDVPIRKSPKHETSLAAATVEGIDKRAREYTPDAEPQPCTSKQSNSPEKITSNNGSGQTSPSSSKQESISSFYQELLEASYSDAGFGQLSESEMLQQAIQMSTQAYMEDQKRKYLYGP